jgi:arsenate reductase
MLYFTKKLRTLVMIQIYHNSRCTKSRECLAFLEDSEKKYEVIKYLVDVPNFDELKSIIKKIGIKPIELVRKKEKLWIENFNNLTMSDEAIIQAMIDNPILIERPIVINGNKAIIARPLENITSIL